MFGKGIEQDKGALNKVSLDVSVVKLWQILKKPTVLSPAAQQLTIFATSIG
jgi:hypothetical protein